MRKIRTLKICFIFAAAAVCLCLTTAARAMEHKQPVEETFASRELLVKFVVNASETEKEQARQMVGAELIKEVNTLRLEHWLLPENVNPLSAIDVIDGLPVVEHAEPNYFYKPQAIPDDNDFGQLWYLENSGQRIHGTIGTPGADISATAAWDIETGSRDVVIAVLDSGVAIDHPDLKNNIWQNPDEIPDNGKDDDGNGFIDDLHGWDFVNNDNNPSDYSKDLYGDGHGTHVAGIIASEGNNGLGTSGVMWQARIMPVQIFDLFENSPFNATTFVVLEALLYAVENGAKIINCSFGGPSFSRFLFEAYQMAGENDILVVAAAGNDALDNDSFFTYPASYALDNIISVAATDQDDALASYSNYGANSVDVAAPGGSGSVSNIYSTTPPPREVMFADDFEAPQTRWVSGGEYESWATVYSEKFNSTVVIDSVNNYHEDEFSYIRTIDPIPARNFRGLNLQFNIFYALERSYDNLNIEISEGQSGDYTSINTITGFSVGIERRVIWSNDTDFDDFYLRFSLDSDENINFDGVYLDDILLSGIKWQFSGDEYGFKSGTSMATPVVAGVAGLVWSVAPGLSYMEVKDIVMSSVDLIPDLAGKVLAGGRVNAEAAVQAAVGSLAVPDPEPDSDSGLGSETDAPDSGGGSGGCFIASF